MIWKIKTSGFSGILFAAAFAMCLPVVWAGCSKSEPKGSLPKESGKTTTCTAAVPADHWKGEYYANKELNGSPAMTRDDGVELNFNWNRTSPNSQCGIGTENFSVRWTRDMAFKGGSHRFVMTVDDGGKLSVDGKLLIDKWIDQGPSAYTADVSLSEGVHHIVMEYYQHVGGTTATLKVEPR